VSHVVLANLGLLVCFLPVFGCVILADGTADLELSVKVINEDGEPVKDAIVKCGYLHPEYPATEVRTDSSGKADLWVLGPPFGMRIVEIPLILVLSKDYIAETRVLNYWLEITHKDYQRFYTLIVTYIDEQERVYREVALKQRR